jgi:DNA-binding GntR family transcriptional regulator
MSSLKNLKTPPSLKEMAFQSIKGAILAQKLIPGRIYNEKRLAEELGISKTPVREALLDLCHKGFVRFIQRRGIQINVLTKKEIKDLYEVRRELEIAIIRNVALKLTDEDLKKIEMIYEKGKEAIAANDRLGYLRNDREFHNFFANLTENRYMISSIENIRDLADWMGFKVLFRPDLMSERHYEHLKIIMKLRARDIAGSEHSMEEHIQITGQTVLELL